MSSKQMTLSLSSAHYMEDEEEVRAYHLIHMTALAVHLKFKANSNMSSHNKRHSNFRSFEKYEFLNLICVLPH